VADDRNFHGWAYWRWLVKRAQLPPEVFTRSYVSVCSRCFLTLISRQTPSLHRRVQPAAAKCETKAELSIHRSAWLSQTPSCGRISQITPPGMRALRCWRPPRRRNACRRWSSCWRRTPPARRPSPVSFSVISSISYSHGVTFVVRIAGAAAGARRRPAGPAQRVGIVGKTRAFLYIGWWLSAHMGMTCWRGTPDRLPSQARRR